MMSDKKSMSGLMSGMGVGGVSRMPKPEKAQDMQDREDESEGEEDHTSKIMALDELLDAIGDMVSDELKPYVEDLQKKLHEGVEKPGEDEGHEEPDGDEGLPMPPAKGKVDIMVGMGAKPMSAEDEDEDEGDGKGDFLSLLSQRMKKKK